MRMHGLLHFFLNLCSLKINMTMITCEPCGYSSDRKSSFRIHLMSKRHSIACKSSLVCPTCLRTFRTAGPYSMHIKACKVELCPKSFERTKIDQDISNIGPDAVWKIKDLIKDIFTLPIHKDILRHMQADSSDIWKYLPKIDNILKTSITGEIPIQKFYEIAVSVFCESVLSIVITHHDLTIDGSYKLILFKSKGVLRGNSVIRELANASKYRDMIIDNVRPLEFPKAPYIDLLDRLYGDIPRRCRSEFIAA